MARLSQPSLDLNVDRGADNLATRCLCVRPGEAIHVLTWHGEETFQFVARAIERASGTVVRVPLEPLAESSNAARLRNQLAALLARATASVLIAPDGLPVGVSLAVVQTAARIGSRHIHMPRVDPRVLANTVRAEPDLLTVMNERLIELLRPPSRVRLTSDTGTALDITLSPQYPMIGANGRPLAGHSDNLPSGSVFVHPSQVAGVFVCDRAAIGADVRLAQGTLRRNPLKFTIGGSRVRSIECADETTRSSVEAYLASHSDAGRVGILTLPTNYLARMEIGNDTNDALMPGAYLCLGFSDAEITKAPYEAPVQLRVMGRKQTVEVRGQKFVNAGRFEDSLVEGIDPFR